MSLLLFVNVLLLFLAYVLALCRKSAELQTYQLLVIFAINMSHIIIGGVDQFVENIVYKKGHKFQVILMSLYLHVISIPCCLYVCDCVIVIGLLKVHKDISFADACILK